MKKNIIIVDDDTGIQDIFKMIFERAGYDVTIFPDSNAIIKNQYSVPDIFLLDKEVPGKNGLDICRHLKANIKTRDIPVIIVSASPDIKALSKQAGADDYIEKPFSKKELLDKVAYALQSREHSGL